MDVAGARALKLYIERRERPRGPQDDALTRWLQHERDRDAENDFELPAGPAARDGEIGLRERIAQYQNANPPDSETNPAAATVVTPLRPAITATPQPRRLSRTSVLTACWIVAITATVAWVALRPATSAAPAAARISPATPTTTAAVSHTLVALHATTSYDPYGSGDEHSADAAKATDGNPNTHWETHSYYANGFQKPGTGLLIHTTHLVQLRTITILTDSPGFEARILVASNGTNNFSPDSPWKTITPYTTLPLNGKRGNTWILWLRLPSRNGHADINEITARR